MPNLLDIHRQIVEDEERAERERPWREFRERMASIGWRLGNDLAFDGPYFELRAHSIAGNREERRRLFPNLIRDWAEVWRQANEVYAQMKRDAYRVEGEVV